MPDENVFLVKAIKLVNRSGYKVVQQAISKLSLVKKMKGEEPRLAAPETEGAQ